MSLSDPSTEQVLGGSLSDLSIKNPVFAVMLSAAMIVFGYLGYRDMGVSQFPEIDFPVVSIAVTREGSAPPDVMDGDVTDIVEDAVSGIEGINYLMSKSLQGQSITTVFFHLDRNIDAAMQDVQNAVAAARRKLPFDIDPPVISKVNPNNLPVIWLTFSASTRPGAPPQSIKTISDFTEKDLKQELARVKDFGGLLFAGLQPRNIRIHHDRDRLATYGLTAEDLKQAVLRQHSEQPGGYIQSRFVESNLRIMGEAYSLREMEQHTVLRKDNQQIPLKDVAVTEDGAEDRRSFARYSRMPTVAVGVRKAIGGNLVAVCDDVRAKVPTLRKMLPPGVELNVPIDYSVFVRENVEELKLTLFLGIVLTAGVCFLFLGSLGTTINICLSIPTSLIGTFFMLKYGVALLGMEPFTINLMTLLGLSLSVGVVVDDAILVLENIYRHRELGADRKTAALVGAKEITFAAMAATFSIMAIFLPVAFMKGTIGKFFFQFGVTVSVAVFLSLLSALTLTPMLCAFFLNLHEKKPSRPRAFGLPLALVIGLFAVGVGCGLRALGHFAPEAAPLGWWPALLVQPLASSLLGEPVPSYAAMTLSLKWWGVAMVVEFFVAALLVKFGNQLYWLLDRFFLGPVLLRPTDWFLDRMTTAYAWTLRWSLHFWYVVLGVGFALIAVAVAMLWLGILGMELTPSEDQSRFVAHIVCPVGSSIDYIDNRLQECERKLQVMPEVASFLTTVATEPGQLMNEADIFVQLVPREERHGRNQTYVMRKVREALNQVPDIRVVLRDQSTEGFTAQRGEPVDFALQGDWEHMPTIAYWFLEEMTASRKFQDIDTDYRPGMPEVRIHPKREKLALVNMSMENVANSLSLHVGGQRIAKFTEGGRRYDIRMRMQLPQRTSTHQLESILLRSGDNRLVPLVDIASLETVSTLPVINRYSHQRKIQITASPADGVSQGEAIDYFQKVIRPKIEERYKTWQQNRAGRDFTLTELGNAQAMRETIDSLVFALVFGVAIAYMILGVQFNSFIHPLTVLMAMPFAVTGALVTLWATGDTLNMMSMIGLILLMGLVKKNSIILVDYTNQLREEGLSVKDAVLKACPVRLRPILMTSIATIAGAIPAAVGLGPGAETRAPMARSIIGGIILSTLVTLVLVPVFYIVVERLREAAKRLIIAPADPAPTAPS